MIGVKRNGPGIAPEAVKPRLLTLALLNDKTCMKIQKESFGVKHFFFYCN